MEYLFLLLCLYLIIFLVYKIFSFHALENYAEDYINEEEN